MPTVTATPVGWQPYAPPLPPPPPPSGQPGPNSLGAPEIPDGVWPMGYQGYVKGTPQALVDLRRDWNFTTDGLDLSGYRIHGKVVCRVNNIVGDGFEIIGADTGTAADALLDFNTHFTGTPPNLKNFTIAPTVSVKGTNGWMGDEATLFNFDISGVSDTMSPNNLHNGGLPLNLNADWGYCHDYVYFVNDSHPDGTHGDGAEIVGGTNAGFSRVYFTGCSDPTRGDGAYLRTHGPNAGPAGGQLGPRPLGQGNSAIQFTQDVSHVGAVTFDKCRFGGGWYASVNLAGKGSTTQLGPITISNSLFDGNSLVGNDIGGDGSSSPGTNLILINNRRVDGKPLVITRVTP